MRKIESEMIAAVKGDINWKKDNTSVVIEDGISKVYLHGNLIAEIDDVSLKLYDCLLYTSPSPRDQRGSRMPSSA